MGSLLRPRISKVAIVGAGPAGTSTARYLLAEKAYEKIEIFEQRRDVGGVWNLTSNTLSKRTPIPQLDPNYVTEGRARQPSPNITENDAIESFETPLYDTLETNIPKQLMCYADKPFADNLPLFPRHESVLEYCKEYAEETRSLIRFGCQVSQVRPVKQARGADEADFTGWSLTVTDTMSSTQRMYEYDAVVIANGHYSIPYIPQIRGLEAWASAYPGAVMHSKVYRNPTIFTGKKVIVVGNSASGVDIGAQIGQVCHKPLLQASRSQSIFLSPGGIPWKEDVAEIVDFLDPSSHNRSVRLADGRIEKDVDAILFATGYFYSFPFLQIDPPVISNGSRAHDIYQQLFHIRYPTLAFPLLPQKIIPFPNAENQAAVIARVWSGRLKLPSQTEMRAWEKDMLVDRGDGKGAHVLNFPQDADYLNMLYDWAASAPSCQGLENDGRGKLGTRWDEKQKWLRSQFPAIKKAYVERGEERFAFKTVEALGFDYQAFKESQ